jgi:hypothetical protein
MLVGKSRRRACLNPMSSKCVAIRTEFVLLYTRMDARAYDDKRTTKQCTCTYKVLMHDKPLYIYTGCGISQLTENALQCIVALIVFTK